MTKKLIQSVIILPFIGTNSNHTFDNIVNKEYVQYSHLGTG